MRVKFYKLLCLFSIATLFFGYFSTQFLEETVGSTKDSTGICLASDASDTDCDGQTQKDWLSVAIIFIGIFTVGIGSTGIFSFGLPYLDDNAEKNDSPIALSFAMTSRVFGPALGYILGSFSLKVYVNPGRKPEGKYKTQH